ncbi:hypothetical protein AAC978_00130 [Desulfitobacterium sp. THU1]
MNEGRFVTMILLYTFAQKAVRTRSIAQALRSVGTPAKSAPAS